MSWDLPIDKEEFLSAIGGAKNLEKFMQIPAATAMPQELRKSLGTADPKE